MKFQMLTCLWVALLLLQPALSQTTDKYSDEDRPYKFGFNIQGYQHRQEEKDEKGLIKGEYGFITADGYYRVTVYATDENGDFRIISMKNYYVGFPPEDPTTTPGSPTGQRGANQRQPQFPSGGQPQSNPVFGRAPGAAGRALGADDNISTTPKVFTRPQGLAACSDCSIPTTPRPNQGNFNQGDSRTGRTRGGSFGPGAGQGPGGRSSVFPQASPVGNVQAPGGPASKFPQRANAGGPASGQAPFSQGVSRSNAPFSGSGGNAPTGPGSSFGEGNPQRPGGGAGFRPVDGTFGTGSPRGRTEFTQGNRLDDTPQRRPQIGEVREGLPPGVTLNDIKDLLYTFNYTVGFHGHHEDGYRNGDKQGDYFFDGRDGVERKVEYLANEFGFQPNITLIDLPENDVRRPNEQTEKEYGLKGYEFKWFYRK